MKKLKGIIILLVIIAVIAGSTIYHYDTKKILTFNEHLDEVVLTVDQTELSLGDIAFYVAYEETTIEDQANIYDSENTNAYWNLHIDGNFVKVSAKQAVIDMAVHDVIMSSLAEQNNIALTEEEKATVKSTEGDFWSDLTDEQKSLLGVSEETIYQTMEQLALAQKYQTTLSEQTGYDYESYNMAGGNYEKILEEHTYEINGKLWNKIDFGNVIVPHN